MFFHSDDRREHECVTLKITRASEFFMTTRERGNLISLPGRGKTKLGLVGDWGTMYVNSEYLSLIFSSPATLSLFTSLSYTTTY